MDLVIEFAEAQHKIALRQLAARLGGVSIRCQIYSQRIQCVFHLSRGGFIDLPSLPACFFTFSHFQ